MQIYLPSERSFLLGDLGRLQLGMRLLGVRITYGMLGSVMAGGMGGNLLAAVIYDDVHG